MRLVKEAKVQRITKRTGVYPEAAEKKDRQGCACAYNVNMHLISSELSSIEFPDIPLTHLPTHRADSPSYFCGSQPASLTGRKNNSAPQSPPLCAPHQKNTSGEE